MSDSWPDQVQTLRDEYINASSEIYVTLDKDTTKYANLSIYEKIDRFAAPTDTDSIDAMVDILNEAASAITKNEEGLFGRIRSPLLDDWQGAAADNFSEYLSEMMDASRNQQELLNSLAYVTEAYGKVSQAVQVDFVDLVNHAITGLNNGEMQGKAIGATVVGAIAGFAAATTVVGKVASIITSAGAAVAQLAAATDEEEVHASFHAGLGELLVIVDEETKKITDAYAEIGGYLRDNLPTVNPPQPMITTADHFDPDKFGLDDSEFDDVKSEVSTDKLVEEHEAPPAGVIAGQGDLARLLSAGWANWVQPAFAD